MADGKSYKGLAIAMSVVAGALLIVGVAALVMYNKKVKSGDIVVKPSGAAAGTAAPKTTASNVVLPSGSRVAPGTFVSVSDPTAPGGQKVVDLYSYAN